MRHGLAALRAHALANHALRGTDGPACLLPALSPSLAALAAGPAALSLSLAFALPLPATALAAALSILRNAALPHDKILQVTVCPGPGPWLRMDPPPDACPPGRRLVILFAKQRLLAQTGPHWGSMGMVVVTARWKDRSP